MKKSISILLIVCMLLSLIPAVSAEGAAAQVGSTAQLQSAFAAGGNVVLADSFTLTGVAEVPANVSAVLDLAGKTITSNDGASYYIKNAGNLTVIDSVGGGGISVTSTSSGTASNYCVYNEENAGLRIEGGTYSITSSRGTAYALFSKGASVTIAGGTFSARYSNSTGSYAAHTLGLGGTGSVAIIENGVFDASGVSTKNTRVAPLYILKDSSVQITINGGVFTGTRTVGTHGASAIRFNSANSKLTINGGTFSAVNSGEDNMFDSIKGSVSITGGSFTYDGQIFSSNTAQISGGKFVKTDGTKNDVSACVLSGYKQQGDGTVVASYISTQKTQAGVQVSVDRAALGADNAAVLNVIVAIYDAETKQMRDVKLQKLNAGESEFEAEAELTGAYAKVFLTDADFKPVSNTVALAGTASYAAPEITLTGPVGSIDTVPADVRAYLADASAAYDNATLEQLLAMTSPKSTTTSLYENFYQNGATVFTWTWDNRDVSVPAENFTVQLSLKRDFSSYKTIACASIDAATGKAQSEDVWNLYTGATYYWRVAATLPDETVATSAAASFTTAAGPRLLKLDQNTETGGNLISNARDFGGWMTASGNRVPEGRIYRSGRLENASEDGVRTVMEELGIRTEIDLRNPNSSTDGEKAITSLDKTKVKYVAYAESGKQYGEFIDNPTNAKKYLLVFADANNYPILFHCKGGADRTGTLAFILGALVGVSQPDLIKDFELTKGRVIQYSNNTSTTTDRTFRKLLLSFNALEGNTTQEKAWTFCRNAGLTDAEINAIITNIMG